MRFKFLWNCPFRTRISILRDSVRKRLNEKLGVTPKDTQTNIKSVCEELGRVNLAFNIKAFPEKYEKNHLEMNKQEAEEICSFYENGSDIFLTPLNSKPNLGVAESYSYHCKIRNEVYGPLLIKVLTLEENKYKHTEGGQFSRGSVFERRTEGRLTGLALKGGLTNLEVIQAIEEKSEEEIDDEDMFTTEEEEKEEGWVDLGQYTEQPRPSFQLPLSHRTSMATDRGLLTKAGGCQENTENNQMMTAVSPRGSKQLEYNHNDKNGLPFSDSSKMKQVLTQRRAKSSLATSNLSMISQKKKLSSLYLTSLGIKYYSKPFRALLTLKEPVSLDLYFL